MSQLSIKSSRALIESHSFQFYDNLFILVFFFIFTFGALVYGSKHLQQNVENVAYPYIHLSVSLSFDVGTVNLIYWRLCDVRSDYSSQFFRNGNGHEHSLQNSGHSRKNYRSLWFRNNLYFHYQSTHNIIHCIIAESS